MKKSSRASALLLPVAAILIAGVATPRAEELGAREIPPAPPPAAVPVSLGSPSDAPIAPEEARPAPPAIPPAPSAPPPRVGEPLLDAALGRFVAPLGDR